VQARILPMSDESVRTVVKTASGYLSFQEFFVRDRFEPQVEGVSFEAEDRVEAGPAVVETIHNAGLVIIAPSNPITSIGPILFVPGIREALRNCPAPVVAVSPIVGSAAVSGPAAKLMRASGYQVSPAGVAEAYRDFLDVLVADANDAPRRTALEAMGVRVRFTDTIMRDPETAERLARLLLREAERSRQRMTS
jgi:LPPG:FO 2-phospho-L-lactate transferase